MTQPAPIPFPKLPTSAEGQPELERKPASPLPVTPVRALKRVPRLPLTVPGARQVWPSGVD